LPATSGGGGATPGVPLKLENADLRWGGARRGSLLPRARHAHSGRARLYFIRSHRVQDKPPPLFTDQRQGARAAIELGKLQGFSRPACAAARLTSGFAGSGKSGFFRSAVMTHRYDCGLSLRKILLISHSESNIRFNASAEARRACFHRSHLPIEAANNGR
jgi:hypothetical protein